MPEPPDPVAAVTHADPYPYYARLVRERPLAWDDGLRCWIAASADAVQAVLGSPLCRVRPPGQPVPPALAGTPAGDVFGRLARMTDGATHAGLKAAVSAATAAVDLARVEADARRWTRALWEADGWCAEGGIPLGFRLPVYVVAGSLGVPDALLPTVARWTGALVGGIAPGASADAVHHAGTAAMELASLFSSGGLAESAAVRALERGMAGAGCPVGAAAANAVGLLMQTHDATAGLLGNAIVAMAENPDVHRALEGDSALTGALVDEVLRHDAPVQNTRRWVAESGTVAGREMQAGDAVLVLLAAANRDPAANPHPHELRLERADRQTFGFGHGRHACPGAAIARTLAAAALAEMVAMRVDFARLAAGRAYHPSVNARIPRFGTVARSTYQHPNTEAT